MDFCKINFAVVAVDHHKMKTQSEGISDGQFPI